LVDLSKALVDLSKALVDLSEPFVDPVEPLVDLREAVIDLRKPLVNPGEPALDGTGQVPGRPGKIHEPTGEAGDHLVVPLHLLHQGLQPLPYPGRLRRRHPRLPWPCVMWR